MNVRELPTTISRVVGTLAGGARVALDERIESIEQNAGEKCGRTDRWIAVRAGNVTGFVRGDLVRRVT